MKHQAGIEERDKKSWNSDEIAGPSRGLDW